MSRDDIMRLGRKPKRTTRNLSTGTGYFGKIATARTFLEYSNAIFYRTAVKPRQTMWHRGPVSFVMIYRVFTTTECLYKRTYIYIYIYIRTRGTRTRRPRSKRFSIVGRKVFSVWFYIAMFSFFFRFFRRTTDFLGIYQKQYSRRLLFDVNRRA